MIQLQGVARTAFVREARAVLDFDLARQLAFEYGTPLLVVSKSKLIDTYHAMRQALPGVDLYYAAKSNCDLNILSTLCAENAFVDICSEGELDAALAAGFTPDRMLHTHPCKTDRNLLRCYDAGVRWFVFDNSFEAEKIARLAPDASLLMRLAVSGNSSMINLSSKFGAPLEDALEILQCARQLGLNVRGFSFHVGSQCIDPEDYRSVLRSVRGFWDQAAELGFGLEILDIGGGFPAPYLENAPTMDSFGFVVSEGLRESFGDLPIRLIAEPGRGLSAECTTLITRVIGKSTRWGTPWYIIDDGLYGSFSGKVFDHADFPLIVENAWDRGAEACVIAGPTCDSSDVVSRDQYLPVLEVGELLLVPSMGAYAGASASPFNGLPVARTIQID
ncbi:type III PLP-dependent enzyme [Roseiconus lacunae]|uniref:type III PLP-dependent enzyme n=1 Tax=Roseiconus lacunae TaxID=2605694 RepID=UPI001359A769|nr:type III PLP-dependent enzyme [Roseiconus lacunae]